MEEHNILSFIVQNKNVPRNVAETAQTLLQEWNHPASIDTSSGTVHVVCALFVASTIHRSTTEGQAIESLPTLSDLLEAGKIHIKQFFDGMAKLQSEQTLHESVKPIVKAIMQKYCVTSALYHKFQQLFKKIFVHEDGSTPPSLSEGLEDNQGHPNRRHICWALFLLAKGSLQQASNELMLPLHLLICCIEYTTKLSPAFLLQEPFNSAHYSQETNEAVLQALCEEMRCHDDLQDVMSVREGCLAPILAKIPQEKLNQGLEGLPELEFLQQQYDCLYRTAGDIDEQLFLHSLSHLFVQKALSTSDSPDDSPHRNHNNEASFATLTPVTKAINSVQSLKSLLTATSDTPSSTLVAYFRNCSQDPMASIEQRVVGLRDKYVHCFRRVMGSTSTAVARSRFQIGVRLYYRVMEAMLRKEFSVCMKLTSIFHKTSGFIVRQLSGRESGHNRLYMLHGMRESGNKEEKRLSTTDFSSLLLSDPFHRSLLACALEVVNVSYEYSPSEFSLMPGNASRLLFPWILDVFSLKAYDFGKVLESFVKDEPKLTQEAKKYLQSIETKIVESMAWQSASPLHDLIQMAGTTLNVDSPVMSTTNTNGITTPRTTAADMYLSPMRPNPNLPKSSHTSAQPPAATSSPLRHPQGTTSETLPKPSMNPVSPHRRTRSVSLNMFLNKVLQLAYGRLERLCGMLNISKDLEKFIWTCVGHCITNKSELLRNRHLDQIIMSCIFAICKVTDKEVKFKDIVNAYRTLPHAEATTYRNVVIDGTREDSIIVFYNKIFMPAVKAYILQFQPKNQNPSISPAPTRTSASSQVSPGVKVAPNLYISPMKESPFKSPYPLRDSSFGSPSQVTPRKRTHYSFGEGPGSSEKLREINEQMKEINNMSAGSMSRSVTSKRLKFEEDTTSVLPGDGTDNAITTSTYTTNGTSSANGHSGLPGEEIMHPLPPSMQQRVAMIASERQASVDSQDKKNGGI